MRFDEHPTWKMLRDGIDAFKILEKTSSAELSLTAREAVRALYSLQLSLEDELLKTGEFDEPED